jgi:aromatic ring-cleaving dioxygenase
MIEKTTQSVANLGYHAHIYYDPTRTRAVAERVCAAIGEKFRVEIDGFRDTPVGPTQSPTYWSFSSPTSSNMSCRI